MIFLQEISSFSSPKNTVKLMEECICDKPRKLKKPIEEIKADQELTDVFKKELKKDIFKLCRDYNGKYWRDDRVTKKPEEPIVKKKGHFLPPLEKKPSKSRSTRSITVSDFGSLEFETEYCVEEEEEEEVKEIEIEIEEEMEEDDYHRKKHQAKQKPKGKVKGKNKGKDEHEDGDGDKDKDEDKGGDKDGDKGGDKDDDKDGDKDEDGSKETIVFKGRSLDQDKGKGLGGDRDKRKSMDKRKSGDKGKRKSEDKNKGKRKSDDGSKAKGKRDSGSSRVRWSLQSGEPSSEFSSDLEMLSYNYEEEYDEEKEDYSQYSGDKRTGYLVKYHQLKKMAAKLDARARRSADKISNITRDKSADITGGKTANRTADAVADETADRTADGTVDRTADGTADQTRDETADRTADVTAQDKKSKDNDYGEAYKIGFGEGLKKAFSVPPIYENTMHKDYIGGDQEVCDDFVFEDFGYEDSAYNIYTIPKIKDKTKVVYIATDQKQINALKKIYKDIEIRMVIVRQFAAKTERVIEKKVEEYIDSYKQMILDKSTDYKQGFKEGFVDGFYQTFLYHPNDESFKADEKFYVNEVRKCVLFGEEKSDNLVMDALKDRAENLKETFKDIIDFDVYERKVDELVIVKSLEFTKSDFIFFYDYRKKKRKPTKISHVKHAKLRREKSLQSSSSESSSSHTKRKVKTGDHALDYLNRHNIGELFRYMGIMLCSYKPDDPIDFLIKLLEKCLLFRNNETHNKAPLVFTEKHVESIYTNMDPFNYGHIDRKQYLYGLNLLEITEPDDLTLVQNTDTVDRNQFLINANDRLLEKFRVMIAIC